MGKRRPGTTLEAVENEMISLAIDEARKRIEKGTASSQLLTTFIREGTVRAQLEKKRLEKEVELVHAKTEGLQSAKRLEELMGVALEAMRTYKGVDDD